MVPSPSLPRTASNGVAVDVDDDGHPKRTGTVWTACIHILTTVIGSGILSLVWATAQLGWIAGPAVMLLFSFVTYYTATLLADCYRSGDPVTGIRNYTYKDAVRSNLGGTKSKIFALVYYSNLLGVAMGYTIASSASMTAIRRSDCFEGNGDNHPCHEHRNAHMIVFGGVQFIFSQIPDFNQLWFLVFVTAVMSVTYSTIGLGLSIQKVAETGKLGGSVTGISIGAVTETQKIWRSFQALGVIAFAYSFSSILIEIQDTIKSNASEAKTMKKASAISLGVITLFYMLCGCIGYAAFGDLSPSHLLVAFGFYNPNWLIDIANAALAIHLIGAYQVYCQPFFKFVEEAAADRFPDSEFITREYRVPIPGSIPYNLNLFRLVLRTIFVITTTMISMLLPFFKEAVSFLGAWGFWPLTVYFPVEMYIVRKQIPKWSTKWVFLQILSFACLVITVAAAAGSIAGVFLHLNSYKPFKLNHN